MRNGKTHKKLDKHTSIECKEVNEISNVEEKKLIEQALIKRVEKIFNSEEGERHCYRNNLSNITGYYFNIYVVKNGVYFKKTRTEIIHHFIENYERDYRSYNHEIIITIYIGWRILDLYEERIIIDFRNFPKAFDAIELLLNKRIGILEAREEKEKEEKNQINRNKRFKTQLKVVKKFLNF